MNGGDDPRGMLRRRRRRRAPGTRNAPPVVSLALRAPANSVLDDWGVGPVHGATTGRHGWWQREPLTVVDVMNPSPTTVAPDTRVQQIAALMQAECAGSIVVVDAEHRLVGMVTERDIIVRGFVTDCPANALRAVDVMGAEVHPVSPDLTVRDAVDQMGRVHARRLPVVDDADRLVGVISLADVAARADEDEEIQAALERISGKRSFWTRLGR